MDECDAQNLLAVSMLAYIPPAIRHSAASRGKEPLEYAYVVAPEKTGWNGAGGGI
jgi:hypothetical protein